MFGFTIGMDDLIKLLHNQKIPKTRLFGEDMIITSGWCLLIDQLSADSNRTSPFSTLFVIHHPSSRTNWSSGWTKSVSGRLLPREDGLGRERERETPLYKHLQVSPLLVPPMPRRDNFEATWVQARQLGGKLGNLKERKSFFINISKLLVSCSPWSRTL